MLATLRTRRGKSAALTSLSVLLVLSMVLGAGIGAMEISPARVVGILAHASGFSLGGVFGTFESDERAVLLSIRLPRILLGVAVGGGLAIAGATMQGLFRNPLADPGLLGVSSGAALAAFAVIVCCDPLLGRMAEAWRPWLLPAAAFAGSLAALFGLYGLSRDDRGRMQITIMLLAGIAINALCWAGVGLFSWMASDAQLRSFTFWSMGSLGGALWPALAATGPIFLFALIALVSMTRSLNLLALGESEAAHLGVRVERFKIVAMVLCALMVGAAVSVSGAIGFVGLVVPHILRMAGGPDHRWLLPASALGGGILLLCADMFARTLVAPAELPIGILTALTGAPFFLWLLLRSRRSGAWM